MPASSQKQGKAFFFEKNEAKNFWKWASVSPDRPKPN
jgi:hypothetical protein